MHPHREQYLREQAMTDEERKEYRAERERQERAWLAKRSRERDPAEDIPSSILDQHRHNGWDIG